MAKEYQVTGMTRAVNALMHLLVWLGLGPSYNYVLTVPGRKSGRLYSLPVSLVEEGGRRWLVAPYGETEWVKNARAAGEVTLSRGGRAETVALTELGPEDSALVLKTYLQREDFVRPYFDVKPEASLEAFEAEADRHPVFRLQPG